MSKYKPGDRVMAIYGADEERKEFEVFGAGVYQGEQPVEPGTMAFGVDVYKEVPGLESPCILLDSGEKVFGCECWWGSEALVQFELDQARSEGWTVKMVNITEEREKARQAVEKGLVRTEKREGA